MKFSTKIAKKIKVGFILLPILLCACSLYQSPGRKYLEKQVFDFTGTDPAASVSGNASSCQYSPRSENWELVQLTSEAELYTFTPDSTFELQVRLRQTEQYNCIFRFQSAEELAERTSAAIDYTLAQWSMSPVATTPSGPN